MTNVLRLAIADPNDDTRESLKSILLGMDTCWLEAECSRYDFFPDVVEQTKPEVGIINIDDDPDKAIQLVESIGQTLPDCSILVVSSSSDGQLILRAMRAGAREFLNAPVRVDDLLSALGRIRKQSHGGVDSSGNNRSSIIAVCGATGGVGSTSVAVNLAAALAQDESNTVVLVDLDLSLGDADVFLDSIPEYTLLDVAQNVSRLDLALLKKSLTRHETGLYLLPRPVQLQDISMIEPEDLSRVFGLLKASFSHMVIDLSKGYNQLDFVALDVADHVLLVSQLDLPCLRNVVRLMMSFEEYDGLKDKIKVIVNRTGLDSSEISLRKAQDTMGTEVYAKLPNDYGTMVEVRNNGVPLVKQAPKAAITHAVKSLAEKLCGHDADAEGDPKRSGWLSFLSSKS